MKNKDDFGKIPVAEMPLSGRHWLAWAVSSMEQVIGAVLSTLVGIAIPMIQLCAGHGQELSGLMQGVVGAAGLLGIAVGSPVIGRISDREGYLRWFRICPLLIFAASICIFLFPHKWVLVPALFVAGFGVGGGYTLDSDYISEMMPAKWRQMMVGAAKATCAIGFCGSAALCWWWLATGLPASRWGDIFLIMGALGLITFLFRIEWAGSPRWLIDHGFTHKAQEAARKLLGPEAEAVPIPKQKEAQQEMTWGDMFKGENLTKVIFSGVTWACEGVGVYGVGVFLPLLIIALGFDRTHALGMAKVINSVEMTTLVNFFIIPGFLLGLLIVRRVNHGRMMTWGFLLSAAGMGLLLWAYHAEWPVWISIVAFMTFEIALNGGPHLVTFIIPTEIYPVSCRGLGDGIASMFGKAGAIIGVFLMPLLLEAGGITLVLIVCIATMLVGAAVSAVLTPRVLP